MAVDDVPESPPTFGRIPRPRGFLPLNEDSSPMATHGQGVLGQLITSRSSTGLNNLNRRNSVFRRTDTDDEETAHFGSIWTRRNSVEEDAYRRTEERRMSAILMGPQMRSQRLIGNSNPRYHWARYWKTEEELKKMRKPM